MGAGPSGCRCRCRHLLVADTSHFPFLGLSFLVCRRGRAACPPGRMAMEDGAGAAGGEGGHPPSSRHSFCSAARFLNFQAWWGSRGQGHFREQRAALALALPQGLFRTLPWWHQWRHAVPSGDPQTDPGWNLQGCRHTRAGVRTLSLSALRAVVFHGRRAVCCGSCIGAVQTTDPGIARYSRSSQRPGGKAPSLTLPRLCAEEAGIAWPPAPCLPWIL